MDKYQALERRIAALEKWQADKKLQQISFPLDTQSVTILKKYFMRIVNTIKTIGGVGGNEFITYLGEQDDKIFQLDKNTFIPYTVNVATDILSVIGIRFDNDTQVYFSTEDTAPTPLDAMLGTSYFIVNSSGNSFQVAATQGGAAIDITDQGVGHQYIYFF